jgi:hypothetical protein
MIKEQIKQALKEGAIVRHRYFSDNEAVRQQGVRMIFEDGVEQSVEEFWGMRTLDYWNADWEIVKPAFKFKPTEDLEIKKEHREDTDLAITIGPKDDPRTCAHVFDMPNEDIGYAHNEARSNAILFANAREVLRTLEGILDIGKRDMSNPKYDPYFNSAKEIIKKIRRG